MAVSCGSGDAEVAGAECAGAAQAAGFHAGVQGDELDAVFSRVDELAQAGANGVQLGGGEPDFRNRLLPVHAVAFEAAAHLAQAAAVVHVVGDEVEGAGHGSVAG